jgi:hypothetical protein
MMNGSAACAIAAPGLRLPAPEGATMRLRLCSVLCLACAVSCAWAAANVDVWTPPATVKVLLEQPWPQKRPPIRLNLDACRGEVEWGQVVVQADSAARVQVRLSAWEGPDYASGALPQGCLHVAHYVRVDFPSGNRVYWPASWPDPLPEGDCAAVEAGRNQAFYVRATVPADCPPGLYRAQLTVWANGTAVARVPVRLRVWDIQMPAVPRMRSSYYVWWDGLRERYKLAGKPGELQALNRFFDFLLERRLCPMTLPDRKSVV